jgi:small-conductance mechanosensitive channel
MMERWLEWWFRNMWFHNVAQICALILAAWVLRKFVIRWFRRAAQRTESSLDDELVTLFARALTPILVLAVVAVSLNLLPLSLRVLAVTNRLLYLGTLMVGLYFISKVLQLFLNRWLARKDSPATIREPVRFLTRLLFSALAIVIVLDNLGISLTAVWTTLGVGSVAVALALQDTLSNFFAGIYLRADSPVRVGDYVKLDSGEEGFVIRMSWRSTRIRTLPNNVVVVPNSKLASATVTNFSLPEPEMSLLIPVSVSYSSDPERVERILVEEAIRAAGKIEGLRAEPAPFVRFIPGYGESSLDFTLICRVNTFVDQYFVQHELRKRIFARFRKEEIEIPFPQRDVHLYAHGPMQAAAVPESGLRRQAEV